MLRSPSPSILVVANSPREYRRIGAVIQDTGLVMMPATDTADALDMLRDGAAAIVALPDADTREFLRAASVEAPNARLLLVVDADAAIVEDERVLVVRRPLHPQELFGQLLELMLREELPAAPHHHAAELGITAAQLGCLCMRETSAAAKGAGRMIKDLSLRIADLRAGLAAAVMPAGAD